MKDGSIEIGIDIAIEKAEKSLQDLKDTSKESAKEVRDNFDIDVQKMEQRFKQMQNDIQKTRDTMSGLTQEINRIEQAEQDLTEKGREINELYADRNRLLKDYREGQFEGTSDEYLEMYDEIRTKITEATEEAQRLQQVVAETGDKETLTGKLEQQQGILDKQVGRYEMLALRADELNGKMKGVDVTSKSIAKSTNEITKGLSGGVKKLIRYAGALFGIRTAYNFIRKISSEWLNGTTVEAQQARASIEAMTSMLSNALAPVIQWLIGLLSTLFGYFNAILKTFFGIELSAKKTAKSTGGIAKGTAKARKEAERFSASFDKAEVMSEKIADNIGGGGGGGMDSAMTTAELDTSKFESAIEGLKAKLKEIWETDTVQSFFDSVVRIGSNSFEMLKSIGSNIWDNLLLGWEEMLPNLVLGFEDLVEFLRLMLEDFADATDEWFPIITESVNEFIDAVFDTFRPISILISEIWRDFWEIVLDLWEEYGADILDKAMEFINGLIDTFEKIWTNIIDPILEPAIEYLSDLWHNHIKDLLRTIGDFVLQLISWGLDIWNKFVKPIIDWLVIHLQPAFAVVFNTIAGVVSASIAYVSDTIKGAIDFIKGTLSGIIDFVAGVFTGDWERAWNGVKDIFSNIATAIGNIFKNPINFIIDSINGFLRGLNRIKIPSWVPVVGGKGFNINEIPRLARGHYADSGSFQALIGESGKEAVVPLENNTSWARDFLSVLDDYGGMSSGVETVIAEINGKVLFEVLIQEERRKTMIMNGA